MILSIHRDSRNYTSMNILFHRLFQPKQSLKLTNVVLDEHWQITVPSVLWFFKSTSSLDGLSFRFSKPNGTFFSYTVCLLNDDTDGVFSYW